MKRLNITELLLIKDWLNSISGVGKVEHARQVADRIIDVDKELWSRLMIGRSPWEGAKKYSDPNFEDTIKDLQKGKLYDIRTPSGKSGEKNS